MNLYTRCMVAVIGFVLPWQTRWILYTPVSGGSVWNFGEISVYVSQAVLAVWLFQEAWYARARLRAWFSARAHERRMQIVWVVCGALLVTQIIVSEDRLLTVCAWVSIALLAGLVTRLLAERALLLPFFGGVLLAAVLQSLLSFMQVFSGVVFPSTLLGIAVHHAGDHGAAVVVYAGARYLRAYGGQPHPNIFGGFMVAVLGVYAWSLGKIKIMVVKKNIIQLSLVLATALFFSFSRTAWIAALIVCGGAWLMRTKISVERRTMLWWCVGTWAVCALVFSPLVWSRVRASGPVEEQSISARVNELSSWRAITRTHVWFGTGMWAYTATMHDEIGYNRVPVHSVPLLVLSEFGVIGVLILLAVCFIFISSLRYYWFGVASVPILLFDHYLYSLWPGLVVSALIFLVVCASAPIVSDTPQKI